MSGNIFLALFGTVSLLFGAGVGRFIHFEPGFEYKYKYESKANLKTVGDFLVTAKVGYTHVNDSYGNQEIYVQVYTMQLQTKHTPDIIDHDLDFSKWFSFEITPQGEIPHVYHQSDDDDEAVAIKKGAAAMFASKLQHKSESQSTEDGWTYTVDEHGHEGHHKATYNVQHGPRGEIFRKTRHAGHHPVKHATSEYQKTLFYDRGLGTIHAIHVEERVRVIHKTVEGFDPLENARRVKPVSNLTNLETPEISAKATGKMEFLTRHVVHTQLTRPSFNMSKSSIHIKHVQRKKQRIDVKEHLKYITGNLTCMSKEPDQGSKQQHQCHNKIVDVLKILPDEEIETLVQKYISGKPVMGKALKDQNHMLDAVATVNTDFTQSLLLKYVLNRPKPNVPLIERYLVHVATLEAPPIDTVIDRLKTLGFKPTTVPVEFQHRKLHNRVILLLGVISRRLWEAGRTQEAVNIVEQLEGQLGLHDPWVYRKRRAVMTEVETERDDLQKVNLIGSLGNAGLNQSFEMIVSHVNDTNSNWVKRAGLHAMRKYQQMEAAHVMLMTALYDEDEKVRYEAMLQYQVHPKAVVINAKYMDPSIMNSSVLFDNPHDVGIRDLDLHHQHHRSKRGILDQELKFILQSPYIEWMKMMGSTTIGASFGLIIQNALDFKIAPLSGHMRINIHDEVYARVHLGFMGFNKDFFQARLCFKGGAEYNLNMLQEYVGDLSKLVKLFDVIKGKASGAIGSAIELFNDIIKGDFSFTEMIQEFKTALEELPDKVAKVGKEAADAMKLLGELDEKELPPFLKPAKNLVMKTTNLYNEVKSSVLSFYNNLMETVTIRIPRAGTVIYKGVKGIIDAFDSFSKDPKQAISTIAGNVLSIGLEVRNLVDALNKTKQALFSLRDNPPDWMDLSKKVFELIKLGVEVKKVLITEGQKWIDDVATGKKDAVAEFTKGKFTSTDLKKELVEKVTSVVDKVLSPVEAISQLGGKFLSAFFKVYKIIQDVKDAYNALKEGYRTARSLIDRIFGPRCHKAFPKTIRQPGGGCSGSGSYPSRLGRGREYPHKGIDVTLPVGGDVVAPFSGSLALSANPNEVILFPTGGSLKDTQVIITNIQPMGGLQVLKDPDYVPTPVSAGQKIGVAANSPCRGNEHIHFSLKKGTGYIDPMRYMEPRLPKMPEWIQTCDDYRLVFKFELIADDCIVCLNGRKKKDTSEDRTGEEPKKPSPVDPSKDPTIIVEAPSKMPSSMYQRTKKHQTALKKKTSSTKDSGLKLLFKKASAFLKNFSIRNLKMGTIMDLLEILGMTDSQDKMAAVILTIRDRLNAKPCFIPAQMTDDELRNELLERGKKAEGSREQMIAALNTPTNACPNLKLGMPDFIHCTFDDMCLGLECCAYFKLFMFLKVYKLYARFDPCDFEFHVGAGSFKKTFGPSDGLRDVVGGFEKTLPTGIILDFLGGIELVIKVKLEKDSRAALISLAAGFCSQDNMEDCKGFFYILNEAPTPLPICNPDGTMTWPDVDWKSILDKESIKKRIRESAKDFWRDVKQEFIDEMLSLIPCISSTNTGNSGPCDRPEKLTPVLLKKELETRSLPTTGTQAELVQRLSLAQRQCKLLDKTITLPAISNEFLNKHIHLEIAPDCMRFDACVDIEFKHFKKAVRAYIELDPCSFVFKVNFEECTEKFILLDYEWGKEKEQKLSEGVSVRYNVNRDLQKKVFIVDLGLKISLGESEPFLDSMFLQGAEIPIPVCNGDFGWPGAGTLKDLAKDMGGKILSGAVDVIWQKMGLDKILVDGTCGTPPSQPSCPWTLPDYKKLLPSSFHNNIVCNLPDNCYGLLCCADFSFDIPLFDKPLEKHVLFFAKFHPCDDFLFEVGFGSYTHKENLFAYNWGTPEKLQIGNGKNAPVVISYMVSKDSQGFTLDLSVDVCIPIDDDTYCYPEGGMQLLKGEKIPACDANALVEYTRKDFNLAKFLDDLDLDINLKTLSQAAARILMDKFGITPYLLAEQCDPVREPYSPAVDGWRNECEKTRKIPVLPKGLNCYLSDTCTKLDCCFHVPLLDRTFNAVLDVDMCTYVLKASIENKTVTLPMLGDDVDLETGISKKVEISKVLNLNYGVKKKDKVLILDLDIEVCFEENTCSLTLPVLKAAEVPQLICDLQASWNLGEFNLEDFARSLGENIQEGFSDSVVDTFLQILGVKDKLEDPQCDRESLKYQPADTGNWKNDCPQLSTALKLPSLPGSANCHINDKCLGIDCCLYSSLLDRSLHASFNIDLCNYNIEGQIEKFTFKEDILNYNWGTQMTENLFGIPFLVLRYKIERLLSQELFLVDLSVSLCTEGPTKACEIDLIVFDQSRIPMPGCAPWRGFQIPDFSFSKWLEEKGGGITAQLSDLLMEKLKIKRFLLENECQDTLDPFRNAGANNWNNQCTDLELSLPNLPSRILGHMGTSCTNIAFCVKVPEVRRNFKAFVVLDACNYYMKIGIEKMEFTHNLIDYKFGEAEVVDLGGLFKLEFKVVSGYKRFLVSMDLKICFEDGKDCKFTFPIFDEMIIPKLICDWEATKELKNFSLDKFVQINGGILSGNLDEVIVEKLLEFLNVSSYLQDPQCTLDDRTSTGWNTQACPRSLTLPGLPESLSCKIPEHCTGLSCCLKVNLINRNVHFKVDLDMCSMTLTLEIENLKFTTLLFKYRYGEPDYFHIKGVFRADFIIDNLEGEKMFLVSLNISACFDSGNCVASIPVMKQARLPNIACDWNSTLSLQGFSLKDWMKDIDLVPGSVSFRFYLGLALGISEYLLYPMCSREAGVYIANSKGWNNACPKISDLPQLPNGLSCHIPDFCTGLDCCLSYDDLGLSFNFKILLDTEKLVLTISIENLIFKTSLFNYKWGQWQFFNLNGVVRLSFKIDDLVQAWKYLLSVKVSLCFESDQPCVLELPVLTDVSFPKLIWNWDLSFPTRSNGFVLDTFMKNLNLPSGKEIVGIALSQVLDRMGLTGFLKDPQCDRTKVPYAGANSDNWKKDCAADVPLPKLPDTATCLLADPCGSIKCCLDVTIIGKSVEVQIGIDPCTYEFTMGIEKLVYKRALSTYKWGTLEHFNLKDRIFIDFMIDDLFGEKKFLINVNVSICMESCYSFPVMTNVKMFKPVCDWDSTAALADFSLTDFLDEFGASGSSSLPEVLAAKLFERLEIAGYLKSEQCQYANNGWNNMCPILGLDQYLPALPSTMSCTIGSTCSMITCCVYVDFLSRSFQLSLNVDTCNNELILGIENIQYKKMLFDYAFGKPDHFYIKGVLRLDFTISKLSERQLEVSAAIKVCLKKNSCLFSKQLMNKAVVPVPLCDWAAMLQERDFSLSDWASKKGLSSTVSDLKHTEVAQLKDDTGAAQYLKPECNKDTGNFVPSDINNWNKECNNVILSKLPDYAKCHFMSDCSTVECCITVPLIKRTIYAKFNVDVCKLELNMEIEKLTYKISMLEFDWDDSGFFLLGSFARLEYKIQHVPASQKIVLDLSVKVCFDGKCYIDVPVFTQSDLRYSPCSASLPVPFKGVSLDFWKFQKCSLPSSTCPTSLPDSVVNVCTLSDNCMGIMCCVKVNLQDLGIFTLSAGIEADHCNNQLKYYIENKSWTKSLPVLADDKNHTESIGNAIDLSYKVKKTPSLYEVSLHVKLCAMVGTELTDTCYYLPIAEDLIFQMPSSCTGGSGRRKKRGRRSVEDLLETGNVKKVINQALKDGSSSLKLGELLDELKKAEQVRVEIAIKGDNRDYSATNTKSVVKSMGKSNPGTILYSKEVGHGNVALTLEGGEKIMKILGQVADVLGRGNQAYTVGKGLTGRGMQLLGAKLANTTIGELMALLDTKNMDPVEAVKLLKQIRDLALALYSDVLDKVIKGEVGEALKTADIVLKGDFSFPRQTITFFEYSYFFLIGGIVPMTFSFGAGAYFGLGIEVGAKILGMTVFGTIVPYGGVHVYGELGIGFILYGKLRFDGFLMNLAFPTRAEIGFHKFPLDLRLTMDLELIPLEMRLTGLVTLEIKISLGFFSIKFKMVLFSAVIWRYATPVIRKRIFDTGTKEEDSSPPVFLDYVDKTTDGRRKRALATARHCDVRQLKGRDYTEPAFEIAMMTQDDRSRTSQYLDAGSEPGLSDILSRVPLGGSSTIVTERLKKYGIPVYFTAYAENSAGERVSVTCSIPTYDITPPGGRMRAEFDTSSNPEEIRGNVVVYEDSEILESLISVGLGMTVYADEVIPHTVVDLKHRDNAQYDASKDPFGHVAQEHFTGLMRGRLIGPVIARFTKMNHAGSCVKKCMEYSESKCLSINYDYGPAGTCELLEAIEGHDYKISIDDQFGHFERLGVGLAYEFIYKDVKLRHQAMYYFNLQLENVLHYNYLLHSHGVLVDTSPPEPGPVPNAEVDILETAPCENVVPDDRSDWEGRCVGVNSKVLNHRIVHDGPGAATVFNAETPLKDLLYTKANRYLAANWDGIQDDETGILGYSMSFGRSICDESVHEHHDPQKHLSHEDEWTFSGVISPLPDNVSPLEDGKYYVTIRALNKVEFGGPLVLSICHTTPLSVDNSPPFMYDIYNITYDEDTHIITAQYNASDPHSGIREIDLCLGETTRDCYHLDWQRFTHSDGNLTAEFEVPGGTPVWIKLRAVNNVELVKVGVASHPLIIDVTPPEAGSVFDGPIYKHDLNYTKDQNQICGNWFGFYDPESGILSYDISVLDSSGTTITEPESFDHKAHTACVSLKQDNYLQHGETYYFHVMAFNAGHKQLNVTGQSNGVIVDLTPPEAREVVDGVKDNFEDLQFSVHTATIAAQWRNFRDPDSDLREYAVKVDRAEELSSAYETLRDWQSLPKNLNRVQWHNFHVNHRDRVKINLKSINNALGETVVETNGFVVDLTPPKLDYLGDGATEKGDIEFQQSSDTLQANFGFTDEESGIDHFKYQVFELYQGSKHVVYPESGDWVTISDPKSTTLTQPGLDLQPGALYSIRVGAINKAGAVTTHDTDGVLVDNTPPMMSWVYGGILSGTTEEVIDGYVIQSDPNGIKATWFGRDHQSGIKSYEVAVGTSVGGNDVLDWQNVGSLRDKYLDHLTLTITDKDTLTPVYYVSVKAINGAGLTSNVASSSPIMVVDQDKPGVVIDGPDTTERTDFSGSGVDIDFQKETGAVTIQFREFESHEHGVTYYDWAVGTTPGGEEVQPFIKAGLVHIDAEPGVPGNGISTMGFAHAVLPLVSGTKYYATVRGITNTGNILESTSNGFTVDNTPPVIDLDSFSNENNKTKLTPTTQMYQREVDSIATSWTVIDNESPVSKMSYSVGTYPEGQDVHPKSDIEVFITGQGALPTGVEPEVGGKSNIVTLIAENVVGLTSRVISPSLVVDTTPPTEGLLTCPRNVQPHAAIECSWVGFYDSESEIEEFEFSIGSHEGEEDIVSPVKLEGHIFKYFVQGFAEKVSHGGVYYAKVKATNSLGLTSYSVSSGISVDTTPPRPGVVVELSTAYIINVTDKVMTEKLNTHKCNTPEECQLIAAVCQESMSSVYLAWEAFSDDETDIVKYEIAVGTTPGGGQLRGFYEVDDATKRYTAVTGLALRGQRQVFVTVKGTNGAGLSSISLSDGIYLSYLSQGLEPLSHVGIWDSNSMDGDLSYQTSLSEISARWDVSGDPCPIVKYEWAIQRADGLMVQDFTDMEGRTHGVNDLLNLKNQERYYQLLRVTNAIDYTYTIRSDGVTIEDDPLVPGRVNDGDVVGYDLNFLRTRTKVSGNWNGFGSDGSADDQVVAAEVGRSGTADAGYGSNQDVTYYEVALGTDRRFPKTRDNVVPYTNVGLNKSVVFYDLDLTQMHAFYYFSVRAYSRSGSRAEVTSNGFSVGFDGGVTAGTIDMKDYVSTNTWVQAQWDGFESDIGMMMYYTGLSTNMDADNYTCAQFTERGAIQDDQLQTIFDVVKIENVDKSTTKRFENLALEQNGRYYVWVIGADKAGKCNMTSRSFQVDTTPPEMGKLRAGPYYDMKLSYVSTRTELEAHWTDFKDDDSGLRCFHIALMKKISCDENAAEETVVELIEIDAKYGTYNFMDLELQDETPYFVRLVVENYADLKTTVDTPHVLFDDSKPSAGVVVDGHDFKSDVSWIGTTSVVQGAFLNHPMPDVSPCPVREMSFLDENWKKLESDTNFDTNNRSLSLTYRSVNVRHEERKLDIKMARDTKKDTMLSGSYFREADLVNGGDYKLSIRAADGEGKAVTSVIFWDGQPTHILEYGYTRSTSEWAKPGCSCCQQNPIPDNCWCKCKPATEEVEPKSGYTQTKLSEEDLEELKRTGGASLNDNKVHPHLAPAKSCGIQIYADGESNGEGLLIVWCNFADNLLQPLQSKVELSEDPSADYHTYDIKFFIQKDEARISQASWCMNVLMDGKLMSEMCGVPHLSSSTKMYLGVWNHDGFVPDITKNENGHIRMWSTEASFKDLVMPPEKTKPCRYGKPFQGGSIAIVQYEAGIGRSPDLADVVNFTKVYSPCIPCLRSCDSYTCDKSCDVQSTDQVKITLDDLSLEETEEVNGKIEPIMYYLSVKAVLGSGTSVVASSDGFNIDSSYPEVNMDVKIMYIDVAQGEFTPADFQGSNNTIKAVWKCADNESEIMDYKWAIGTEPGGEDIQTFQSTGENPGGINAGLEGVLQDNVTYYITMKCTNGGGLTSTYADTKGVVVILEAPSFDGVDTTIAKAEPLPKEVVPDDAMKTMDKNSVGASWTVSKDPRVHRYDFCVGSSDQKVDDIFACKWVGYNESGTVTVEDGVLKVNDVEVYKLHEYRQEYDPLRDAAEADKSAFTMPAGTVMYIYVKMCNDAQLCASKLLGTVLVETESSKMATSLDGKSVSVDLEGGEAKRKKRAVPNDVTIQTPDGLAIGQSIVVTELNRTDLETDYQSVGTISFVAYIKDPKTSTTDKDFLQRVLRGRLDYKEADTSFSVSSVGDLPMPGPLKIIYPYDSSGDTTEMLMHWNPDLQMWQQTNKTCRFESDTEIRDSAISQVTVKVCDTRADLDMDSPFSTDSYFRYPTQFLITKVKKEIPNDPPLYNGTQTFTIKEDRGMLIDVLTAHDANGDKLEFKLGPDFKQSETNGQVVILINGFLTYDPPSDYHGDFYVPVVIYETGLTDIPPKEITVNLRIIVEPVNDPPSVFLFSDRVSPLHDDPTEPVLTLLDQVWVNDSNPTTYKWTFGVYDIDTDDNLTLIFTQPASGVLTVKDAKIEVPCTHPQSGIPCDNLTLRHSADSLSWKYQIFEYQPNPAFYGYDSVTLYAQDQAGVYSDVLTLRLAVMERQCENGGTCTSKNETIYTCSNYRRAEGFDTYYTCTCAPGWTGLHCQEEINECASSPCGWPYVCYDQVNRFYCACPESDPDCDSLQGWMIALIAVACVLFVTISVLAWFLCIRRSGRMTWSSWRSKGDSTESKKGFVNAGFDDMESTASSLAFMPRYKIDPTRPRVVPNLEYRGVPFQAPIVTRDLYRESYPSETTTDNRGSAHVVYGQRLPGAAFIPYAARDVMRPTNGRDPFMTPIEDIQEQEAPLSFIVPDVRSRGLGRFRVNNEPLPDYDI